MPDKIFEDIEKSVCSASFNAEKYLANFSDKIGEGSSQKKWQEFYGYFFEKNTSSDYYPNIFSLLISAVIFYIKKGKFDEGRKADLWGCWDKHLKKIFPSLNIDNVVKILSIAVGSLGTDNLPEIYKDILKTITLEQFSQLDFSGKKNFVMVANKLLGFIGAKQKMLDIFNKYPEDFSTLLLILLQFRNDFSKKGFLEKLISAIPNKNFFTKAKEFLAEKHSISSDEGNLLNLINGLDMEVEGREIKFKLKIVNNISQNNNNNNNNNASDSDNLSTGKKRSIQDTVSKSNPDYPDSKRQKLLDPTETLLQKQKELEENLSQQRALINDIGQKNKKILEEEKSLEEDRRKFEEDKKTQQSIIDNAQEQLVKDNTKLKEQWSDFEQKQTELKDFEGRLNLRETELKNSEKNSEEATKNIAEQREKLTKEWSALAQSKTTKQQAEESLTAAKQQFEFDKKSQQKILDSDREKLVQANIELKNQQAHAEQKQTVLKDFEGRLNLRETELKNSEKNSEEATKNIAEQREKLTKEWSALAQSKTTQQQAEESLTAAKQQFELDKKSQQKILDSDREKLVQANIELKNQQAHAEQKQTVLKDFEGRLNLRENSLNDKENAVVVKESSLTEREEKIIEKEKNLKEKEARMVVSENSLKEREDNLKEKEAGAVKKESDLKEREGIVIKKEGNLKEKEEEMIKKENGLKKREEGIVGKENNLKSRENQITQNEERLKKINDKLSENRRLKQNIDAELNEMNKSKADLKAREEKVVQQEYSLKVSTDLVSGREGAIFLREKKLEKQNEDFQREKAGEKTELEKNKKELNKEKEEFYKYKDKAQDDLKKEKEKVVKDNIELSKKVLNFKMGKNPTEKEDEEFEERVNQEVKLRLQQKNEGLKSIAEHLRSWEQRLEKKEQQQKLGKEQEKTLPESNVLSQQSPQKQTESVLNETQQSNIDSNNRSQWWRSPLKKSNDDNNNFPSSEFSLNFDKANFSNSNSEIFSPSPKKRRLNEDRNNNNNNNFESLSLSNLNGGTFFLSPKRMKPNENSNNNNNNLEVGSDIIYVVIYPDMFEYSKEYFLDDKNDIEDKLRLITAVLEKPDDTDFINFIEPYLKNYILNFVNFSKDNYSIIQNLLIASCQNSSICSSIRSIICLEIENYFSAKSEKTILQDWKEFQRIIFERIKLIDPSNEIKTILEEAFKKMLQIEEEDNFSLSKK